MSIPNSARLLRRQIRVTFLDTCMSSNSTRTIPASPVQCLHKTQQASSFSTTAPPHYPRRDLSKNRGVSAIHSSGLRRRQTIPIKVQDLPIPVAPADRAPIEVDPNHGLWQFFSQEARTENRPISAADETNKHGRAWTVEELRKKNWEDLHSLWWVCVKERNRIATEKNEHERLKAGYGIYEYETRDKVVKRTMRAIKHALTERFYAWENAWELAQNDKEIDLNAAEGQPAYIPQAYEEDIEYDEPAPTEEQSAKGETYETGTMVDKDGKEIPYEIVIKPEPDARPEEARTKA